MVASIETLAEVASIIERYVPEDDLGDFMLELLQVEGNQSFKQSIVALDEILGS